MAPKLGRFRFIPFSKHEIVRMLARDGRFGASDQAKFEAMCRVLESTFHFEFHAQLEALKDAYRPFNPDERGARARCESPEALASSERELVERLTQLLDDANYEPVSSADIEQALAQQSLFRISVDIDFDAFASQLLFWRGETIGRATVARYRFWKREIDVPTYERVVLFVRFKDAEHFQTRKRSELQFEPSSVVLKLFKNIPKADLEMIFPNTRVRMSTRDKLWIGVPGVAGILWMLFKTGTALVAAFSIIWLLAKGAVAPGASRYPAPEEMAAIVAALVALGALAAYVWRQWSAYTNRKILFMKTLADSLYFKNLDNNAGVFFHVVDAAEEEECKEAFLGYYFLAHAPAGLTQQALDEQVERWFSEVHATELDFEVDDALDKLRALDLVVVEGTGESAVYRVVGLDEACRRLDVRWDNLFRYNVE